MHKRPYRMRPLLEKARAVELEPQRYYHFNYLLVTAEKWKKVENAIDFHHAPGAVLPDEMVRTNG